MPARDEDLPLSLAIDLLFAFLVGPPPRYVDLKPEAPIAKIVCWCHKTEDLSRALVERPPMEGPTAYEVLLHHYCLKKGDGVLDVWAGHCKGCGARYYTTKERRNP